jgi:hypothetical protein
MKSPIRIFFILPIVIFAIIAFLQLLFNGLFYFALWGFVFIVVTTICWPIVVIPHERYTPIYQMFSIFVAFILMAIAVTFFDVKNYLPVNKALIISIFTGLFMTGLVLFLRGDGK